MCCDPPFAVHSKISSKYLPNSTCCELRAARLAVDSQTNKCIVLRQNAFVISATTVDIACLEKLQARF